MLSILLASCICKRFDKGGKPYTALELKLETGIPIRITNDLLYELTKIHVITEITNDDKGEERTYQPAESLTLLNVGTLVDRLEAEGKWTMEFDMHTLDTPNWKKIMKLRKDYLNGQRDILLKDL